MSTDLNSQIAELTAIENIKKLKAIYCGYCDNNYDPEGLASLFVEDGIWDGGPEFGRHVGKQAIKKFFDGASGSIVFAAHLVMNPIINVAGDKAVNNPLRTHHKAVWHARRRGSSESAK